MFKEKEQTNVDVFERIDKTEKKDFHWVDTELYHSERRRRILKKHPEIRKLYGTDMRTFPITVIALIAMALLTVWVLDKPIWVFLLVGYAIGGAITHTLHMATHELSHDLCFRARWANKLLSIASNMGTGIPSAILFKRYHLEHHALHTVDEADQDLPTAAEGRLFRSVAFKMLWVFLQPFFYSLRPVLMRPKRPGPWELLNWAAVFAFDYAAVRLGGWRCLAFLVYSTLVGLGLHPAAGNLIAEHYEFVRDNETYSYYGPFNLISFNVGYHNEHHDFPAVPWTRLPEVHRVASEFYRDLPCYSSYLKVLYYFITSEHIGPFSRIKREKGRYLKAA